MFKTHWLSGIGFAQFKSYYLQYQANYFGAGDYTVKEMLLAGNTYYAFNDYWQFIIEGGIPAVIITLAVVYGIGKLLILCGKKWAELPLVTGIAISILLNIMIAACFTYVLERLVFQCIALSCFLVIGQYVFFQKGEKLTGKLLIILLMNVFVIGLQKKNELRFRNAYERLEKAKTLFYAGYKTESINMLDSIYPQLRNDENYLAFYGYSLMTNNQYQRSATILQKAIKNKPANLLYQQLGDCYLYTNQREKAEGAYRRAIDMVPNRFGTRYSLFNFYLKTHQYEKAKITGNRLLKLPVKIPSAQINYMLRSVKKKNL